MSDVKKEDELPEEEQTSEPEINVVGVDSSNIKKIKKYNLWHKGLMFTSLLCAGYAVNNGWEMHEFDKYVIQNVGVAANVLSAGSSSESDISMESALSDARAKTNVSQLDNPAIIWKTPLTDVPMLNVLLDKAIERSKEIEQFKQSFSSGSVEEDYPDWVKNAHARINPAVLRNLRENNPELSEEQRISLIALEELTNSEYGQRIANEYSALNNVVAGGTRMSAKNLNVRNKSLLDTLDLAAGWRSIIRFQADDYKDAYAHVFVGYLMANMGDLDESLLHFNSAKDLMDTYPDDKNLSILRNTPDLSQRVIKGLIDSSIVELSDLNNDPGKYSAGWWKRLTYYNQSIGGQANPSISDMSEAINDRYYSRLFWSGLAAGLCFYLAGMCGKKLKLSQQYEVKAEE